MQTNLGEYEGSLGFPRLAMSEMARAFANNDELILPKNWEADVVKIRKVFGRRFILPKDFKAQFRSYQEEGFQWLSRMAEWGAGACLADDMGLGKTVADSRCLVGQGSPWSKLSCCAYLCMP